MTVQQQNSVPPQPPSERPASSRKKIGWKVYFLAFLVVAMMPVLAYLAVQLPLPITAEKTVVIPRGATVYDIAIKLQSEGVAPNRLAFRAMARLLAKDNLQAGEYQFSPDQNVADIVVMMRDGKSIVRLFTVPEGLTSAEIVNLLNDNDALMGDIPQVPDEGSLLPESYRYSFGDSRIGLIERMQRGHKELLSALWAGRNPAIPVTTPEEAVIMASIIEKETGKKAEERPRVAGVFYNRLSIKMRLQSDPTVIYAITKGEKPLGRELTYADLAFVSPYNTYVNAGLPPTPIANPGRASLEAAMQPESHDYFYFVADGTGGHAFAKDLAAHNKNVKAWQYLKKP